MEISYVKLPRLPNRGQLLTLLLLCNYISTVYGLGYHEVWITASTFLQAAQELLLLNYFTLENIFSFTLPPSPPMWRCFIGSTTLGTYWNPPYYLILYKVHILNSMIYTTRLLLATSSLTPLSSTSLLPPNPTHQVPLAFPTVALPQCHSLNQSCNNAMKTLQNRHTHVHHHPYFYPIQEHRL